MENNLNKQILKISDLSKITSGENGEDLVDLAYFCPDILSKCHRKEYPPSLRKILVRSAVAEKLKNIQEKLKAYFPDMKLFVVEGYRHPYFQKAYFEQQKKVLSKTYPNLLDKDLEELTHMYIAYPPFAGHVTGGAIDLTIIKNGRPIDMGTGIADFSDQEKMFVFSQAITPIKQKNRIFLRNLMIEQNFAPFNGEWWHFSYGDREWAAFYHLKQSLYSSVNLDFSNMRSLTIDE